MLTHADNSKVSHSIKLLREQTMKHLNAYLASNNVSTADDGALQTHIFELIATLRAATLAPDRALPFMQLTCWKRPHLTTMTRRAISGKGGSAEERSGSSQPSTLLACAGPCSVIFHAGPCFTSEEERAVGAGLPVCVMSRVSGVFYGMCRLPLCTCSTRDFYS